MNAPKTLDEAKAMVSRAGYTPSAASWQEGNTIYAASVKSVPGTMGHPAFEVYLHNGWLSITGQAPVRVEESTNA